MRRAKPSFFHKHPILSTFLGLWVVSSVAGGIATIVESARKPFPPPKPEEEKTGAPNDTPPMHAHPMKGKP